MRPGEVVPVVLAAFAVGYLLATAVALIAAHYLL